MPNTAKHQFRSRRKSQTRWFNFWFPFLLILFRIRFLLFLKALYLSHPPSQTFLPPCADDWLGRLNNNSGIPILTQKFGESFSHNQDCRKLSIIDTSYLSRFDQKWIKIILQFFFDPTKSSWSLLFTLFSNQIHYLLFFFFFFFLGSLFFFFWIIQGWLIHIPRLPCFLSSQTTFL